MDTAQLEYFAATAKTENMSKAAAQLSISQPALSTNIKRLEEELGTELFTRNGRSIKLNDNGRLLLETVTPMLEKLGTLKKRFAGSPGNAVRTVSIVAPSFSTYTGLVEAMNTAAPNTLINKVALGINEVADALETESVDLCISCWKVSGRDICSCVLAEDRLILYVSKKNPLAKRSIVSLAELQGQSLAAYSSSSAAGFDVSELCRHHGFRPVISFVGDTPGELIEHAAGGKNLVLLQESVYRQHCTREDMKGIPLSEVRSVPPLRLYWRYSEHANEPTDSVRAAITGYFQRHS